ncbi:MULTISPECIES: putative DNA-binding protein [unclassified Vagococcus]|uniref:putative DNA-binding protein n=1 Tax=unclassified Vagococcus TaxID=2648499 RepID=UPI001F5138BD|nr:MULTISPECIES: putative DNA-binding protein [unclassified Vagococcus]MCI0130001.1 putative DNA-binding protein [Vagococcus sp. CY53-2]UNM88848.1 putative DNA-binding protein [Vagococcus sp. CY52-2]
MEIEKTNRMNALFEFYSTLLTEKQMNYIELYYADDFSLGEIAEEYDVSRQAVYDNIKRTEKLLETYEKKLHLYSNYVVRQEMIDEIKSLLKESYPKTEMIYDLLDKIQEIEEE